MSASPVGSSGTFTSVSGQLAALVLETQEQQKETNRAQLSQARHDFEAALDDEVEALRDQADAGRRGALLQSGVALGSSGLQLGALAKKDDKWLSAVSKGLGDQAAPLGKALSHDYGAADAKAAEGAEAAAKWQLDDARDALKNESALQQRTLDWLGSMVDRDAATMAAILSNRA
jgi:hypothetical protein